MIISVSRRTDIPAFYFEWFLNRLQEGFVLVRNPMNQRMVSHIELSPETVDAFVFWSKNPRPLLDGIEEIAPYPFYLHFTLTAYEADLEAGLPQRPERLDTFKRLADIIGPERLIWRYDPIVINKKYPADFHLNAFGQLAENLEHYTERCIISFVEVYAKIKKNLATLGVGDLSEQQKISLARSLRETAESFGHRISACCGNFDIQSAGLSPASCIDKNLLETIIGRELNLNKDKGQRPNCACVQSIDIGTYDTCRHNCLYCYAKRSSKQAALFNYSVNSPMLCDAPQHGDNIVNRPVKSSKIFRPLFPL